MVALLAPCIILQAIPSQDLKTLHSAVTSMVIFSAELAVSPHSKDVNVAGILTASTVDAGIATVEYMYGGFIGTMYNTTGNPIARSEDASFSGNFYGDIFCGTSGFSTFKDVNVAGMSTFADVSAGVITATSLKLGDDERIVVGLE